MGEFYKPIGFSDSVFWLFALIGFSLGACFGSRSCSPAR
jgi:hypothetical protein